MRLKPNQDGREGKKRGIDGLREILRSLLWINTVFRNHLNDDKCD